MPSVRIPALLRAYTGGLGEVGVEGGTVGEAMEALAARYPALRPHLYADGGELRPFVNLFLGEANVKDLQGLETRLEQGDVLRLVPSIAGG